MPIRTDKDECPHCQSSNLLLISGAQRVYDPAGPVYQCQEPGCGEIFIRLQAVEVPEEHVQRGPRCAHCISWNPSFGDG